MPEEDDEMAEYQAVELPDDSAYRTEDDPMTSNAA